MLPLAKALASPRNPQTPALGEQDGAPQPASPGDTEVWRLRFRQFQYRVAGGPHRALGQLWMLCRQWLRPEAHSKEQMLELLVLEQFLSALPSKMRTWVQSQGPRTCREAASLVEDLTQMSQQEDDTGGGGQALLGILHKARLRLWSFACELPVVPAPLLKRLFFPLLNGSGTFVKKPIGHRYVGLVLDSQFLSILYVYLYASTVAL
uniref:SCAN box domain-containing protein n=1 Tax=Ursus maritimus TaxID=29073 RepID=A0A452TAP7_URSMA